MRGSQGVLVWGWRAVDGNSSADCGESPCTFWDSDHRPAWWTNNCSSGGCRTSDVKWRPFWQHCATYLVWFCLWPSRWETSWFHVLGRSWGSGGPEGGDSAKIPCRLGMTMPTTLHNNLLLLRGNGFVTKKGQWKAKCWHQSHSLHSYIRSQYHMLAIRTNKQQ